MGAGGLSPPIAPLTLTIGEGCHASHQPSDASTSLRRRSKRMEKLEYKAVVNDYCTGRDEFLLQCSSLTSIVENVRNWQCCWPKRTIVEVPGRPHLRSANRQQLLVPRYRRSALAALGLFLSPARGLGMHFQTFSGILRAAVTVSARHSRHSYSLNTDCM